MKTSLTVACLALGFSLFTSTCFAQYRPPNWKLAAAGNTVPANDGSGLDLDSFAGHSTHLGRFTGTGFHMLHPDSTFDGFATYTAANGDQLDVIYSGYIVSFEEFPFPVAAKFQIVGGTGRLANAEGQAAMTGGFTGVPGDLFFELQGTLHPKGK